MWKISSGGASLLSMPEDNGALAPAHSRYRALLDEFREDLFTG